MKNKNLIYIIVTVITTGLFFFGSPNTIEHNIILPKSKNQYCLTEKIKENTFSKEIKTPIRAQKKNRKEGSSDLKNSDWYAKAINQIAKAEYNFSNDTAYNTYTTPNRKNNLRFNYNNYGFSVEPRTTKISPRINDHNTLSDEVKANWHIAFNLDATQIGEGKWQTYNNTAEYITKDVTVQYINNEQGMRQNFIVQNPISKEDTSTQKLSLNFSVKTELDCRLNDNALQFYNGTDNVMNYQDLKVWDANHQPLDAHFEKISDTINNYAIVVNTENATYPITIDPISTTPNTTLSYSVMNSHFGESVASAGDVNDDGYSDVIVGVQGYDNGQGGEGAAFIYHGSAAGIGTTANTILEINIANAQFGWLVSTAGDLNGDGYSDVIVSTKELNFGQIDEGGAYVYYGSASGISTATVHFLEANQAYSYFGWSVACAGDINGDGYSDVLVGAPYYDKDGATDGGVVFVYHGSAAGIVTTPVDTLYKQNNYYSTFGKSVASAGDLNADGFSDIVIGAPLFTDDVDLTLDEGAAFVYYGSATGIVDSPIILQCNQAGAEMGNAVASAGDVNGDGYTDLMVGAEWYDAGQINEGVVFVYHGSATGISNSASFVLEVNQTAFRLGSSVAPAGDINGDGFADVIVGQPFFGDNSNGTANSGKAYVFQGSATGLTNNNTTLSVTPVYQGKFGASVASAGDINGDGYSDIIVGQLTSVAGTGTGSAYIYHGAPQGVDGIIESTRQSNQVDAQMGKSVASAGDVNGDGYGDVLIGAPNYDNGQFKEGAAFLYMGTANGISTTATILESNVANAFFGASVANAGDVNGDGYGDVIVGAYGYTNGEANEGAFFIYHGSATGINTTPAFVRESGQVNAQFGIAVSTAGDINGDGYADVIVGSEFYDNGQTDEGAAFIYYGSASGITLTGGVLLEVNQANARFGEAVKTAGDVNGDGFGDVVVGAYLFDSGQNDEGAVFVFLGSATGINTTAAVILQINQDYAQFGNAVAGAGDVNGDGYSDIVVGAYLFDDGQTDEGAAFVYHGSASGINPTIQANLQTNQPYAQLGDAVNTAGDVNGDGYSDIIVGAYVYGTNDEGAAFVYHGSNTGVNTNAATFLTTNQANARFGSDLASAGDVNGDGYSDIIVGARFIDYGENDEGAAFIYNGNEAISKSNAAKDYNIDLQTGINSSNFNYNIFGIGLKSKSFLGRTKGRLVWEIKPHGQPFAGNPITNIIYSNGNQINFTDLGLTGTDLKSIVAKQGDFSKIRVRVQYERKNAITGQIYGPWRYLNLNTENKIKGCTAPTISIAGTNSLTCVVTSVTRTASGGVSYAWSGPNSYTANTAQATFTTAGTYTVTVTGANGCNAVATTVVNFTAPPTNISGTTNLTCAVSSVTRTASGGVSYVWSGPNSYSATTAQATITAAGTYTVTVTGADGCKATATTQVLFENAAPTPIISGTQSLTCYYTSVTRTASGGVSYTWTGPNSYSANTAQANITAPGIYTVTVTGANGCTATAITEVILDNIPVTVTILGTENLSTTVLSVTRTATGGNFYAWTGPGAPSGFSPATITITTPGLYTVYTRGDNYCLATATTLVTMTTLPLDLISFNATWLQTGKTAKIDFKTDNEIGVCCYDIQKSADGFSFYTIGTLSAKNSSGTQLYSFTDNNATAKKQFYRLKTKDIDGKINYSNIQQLQHNKVTEIIVFPNPASDILQVKLNKNYNSVNVQIVNVKGQVVKQYNKLSIQNQTIKIPVNELPSGNYWLHLQCDGEKQVLQFVKQ